MREPFFRTSRKCWFVKDDEGRFIRLDPDRDKAFDMWHHMQAATEYKGAQATVRGLLEAFLDEIDGTVSPERFEVLTYYASLFAQNFGTKLVHGNALRISWSDVLLASECSCVLDAFEFFGEIPISAQNVVWVSPSLILAACFALTGFPSGPVIYSSRIARAMSSRHF